MAVIDPKMISTVTKDDDLRRLKQQEARAIANGDYRVSDFSGAVKAMESFGFEEGDVFTVPTEFNVFCQRVGGCISEYIFVVTQDDQVRKLYPSHFTRRVRKHDGSDWVGYVCAKGTACDLYRKFGSIGEAMDALKGKTIRVSNVERVLTLDPYTDNIRYRTVYTFDLV